MATSVEISSTYALENRFPGYNVTERLDSIEELYRFTNSYKSDEGHNSEPFQASSNVKVHALGLQKGNNIIHLSISLS